MAKDQFRELFSDIEAPYRQIDPDDVEAIMLAIRKTLIDRGLPARFNVSTIFSFPDSGRLPGSDCGDELFIESMARQTLSIEIVSFAP